MVRWHYSVRFILLLALLVCAPLSKFPAISLPMLNFSSFRIGLYQILVVGFVASCLPLVKKYWPKYRSKRSLLVASCALFVTLAIGLTTSNTFARSFLYSASLVALLALGFAGWLIYHELTELHKKLLVRGILWSGGIFGILALIQFAVATLDTTGLGTLCSGCASNVFGFPRINVSAAEPQFFANSLLPAFFLAFFLWKRQKLARVSLALSTLAITLTFSRGAFLAIGGALALYLTIRSFHRDWTALRSFIRPFAMVALFGVVGCCLLVGSATLRYKDSPYITYNTIVSMLEHMSLGLVSIPQKVLHTPVSPDAHIPAITGESGGAMPQKNADTSFQPEGFVEASSNDRTTAATLALDAWNDTPLTVLFGVGMGNLPAYINAQSPDRVPNDFTVYVFYVLLLSSVGLVGTLVVLYPLALVLIRSGQNTHTQKGAYVFCLATACTLQLAFFGTYINTMYSWLWVGIFLAITWPKVKH